ncbi:sensor histidine kinase YesM [Flavobacterium arsenatis]|uniref:Sensor histidine kinase YesM n=1 Tax=Flavobacterium arsenatis TaxID=1484332 RepID=A0ABU1TTP1_9FLAO|nr:histidine kinase [Flavobacterium arsenatis]MDR6969237.1 sensor histidine kinase YesM [Flavobacterium arsenatis]
MKSATTLKNILSIIIVIVLINTIQIYTLYQTRKFGDIDFFDFQDHVFGIITCCISFISTYYSWQFISKRYNQKTIKIGLSFLFALVVFSVLSSIFFGLYRYLIYGFGTSLWMMVGNIVFGVTMSHLYISGYTIAYLHFKNSKEMALDIERLEKEKEIFKSKMLQKNLEPHFLFNNLSVLSSLSRKNQEEMETFIDDFSDVYRYFLKHSEQEIVPLTEELHFIKGYTNLIEKRFNKAYKIVNTIEDKTGFILPCTLQLGIENALKHNRGSENNPLIIELYRIENTVFIKNKLQPVENVSSSNIGNQYLKKHYKLLFDLDINFIKTATEYCVEIPLIP